MGDETTKTTTTTATESEPNELAAAIEAKTTEGVAQDGVQAPVAKTITLTESDLQKRLDSVKGGYEGTLKQLQAELKTHKEAAKQAKLAAEEARFNGMLKSAEDAGQGMDLVQALKAERLANLTEAQRIAEQREELAPLLEQLNLAGKMKKVTDLAAELGLADADKAELLKIDDPAQMSEKALRLALAATRAAATPPKKTDSSLSMPKGGRDISKMSDTEGLGWAIEQALKNR